MRAVASKKPFDPPELESCIQSHALPGDEWFLDIGER